MVSPRKRKYQYLSDDQIDHFMEHGYLRIPSAFSHEKAEEWTKDIWVRLGMDPNDRSTWNREWTNMPQHKNEPVQTFAPNVWGAICELCGGEDRVDSKFGWWSDGIIVNLGSPEYWNIEPPSPYELPGWHCDGDFFLHFLDSPEQGLLVVPLFSDIEPRGGGTMIAPEGIGHIARYMADHPEGVMPNGFDFLGIRDKCTEFTELTGKIGDVILLHPLMLHSASRNNLGIPRFITNPPIGLLQPHQFKRTNISEYSLVELKTLKELGVDPEDGYDFQIVGERKEVVPERIKVQEEWKKHELERLGKLSNGHKGNGVDSEATEAS